MNALGQRTALGIVMERRWKILVEYAVAMEIHALQLHVIQIQILVTVPVCVVVQL
jgi:hypothetical protein